MLRRAGLALVLGGAASLVMPSSASAQEVLYPPSACFSGEVGPKDYVAVSNGPSFFTNVTLLCGDPTKDIIHIDAEHPIDPDGADDDNVRDCHSNVMFHGSEVPANVGNRAWQIVLPSGGATVVFDAARDHHHVHQRQQQLGRVRPSRLDAAGSRQAR